MKHFGAIVCALGIGLALAADTLTVRGELTFSSAGQAQVSECGSDRVFTLGVMASTPYFGLTQRYKEHSDSGKFAVLVEVNGTVARQRSSTGGMMLNSPNISTLARGTCADPTPNNSLERTREG
jgi:hypothetical protein